MALINSTGVKLTYDESAGLQNAALKPTPVPVGDADDNDIATTSLPAAFSSRLSTLFPTSTLTGAALSGYDGTNNGLNIYTLAPEPGAIITGIGFTDSSGAPLNGQDSLVQTLAGNHVFLYTDSANDNIVLGREGTGSTPNPDGAIVFAAYIDESTTAGKLWTAHYQQIKHSGGPDADVSVDLFGGVSIAVAQDLTFSLASAPSGQNLFLMFSTANPTIQTVDGIARIAGPSIIATGKDPANQSAGVNIVTGDTINTGKGGGPTTFGTNSQMIVEQEGIRFTFVTGARQDVTIPNLDQNEADVESNIDFTGMFDAKTAAFDVVQLQSGKSAQVKISAFSTAVESGNAFIDGYQGDAPVAITSVVVKDGKGAPVSDVSIKIDAGVATITGVKVDYNIAYTTTGSHNRVLVENAAAVTAPPSEDNHADFDIGGFKLLQVKNQALSIGSQIFIEDDGPAITEGTPPTVDKILQVGDATLTLDDKDDFSKELAPPQVTVSTDGNKPLDSVYSLGISSTTGVNSGLVDTQTKNPVFLFLENGVVVGRAGPTAALAEIGAIVVFTVSVDQEGFVTLDQQRAIFHPDTTKSDEVITLGTANMIVLSRKDTVTDGDGNTASSSTSNDISLAFQFKDHGPSITVTKVADADALEVDETNLPATKSAEFADNFSSVPNYGADGAGEIKSAYTFDVKSSGVDSGLTDVATKQAVLLTVTNDGKAVEGHISSISDPVFTVTVDEFGKVILNQSRALVHPDKTNPDDSVSLADGMITLKRTDTIIDGDGDKGTGEASLDISKTLIFKDDGPSITVTAGVVDPGTLTVDESNLATNASSKTVDFSGKFSSDPTKTSYGADGPGEIKSAYTLDVQTSGVSSGLIDVATKQAVLLTVNGGTVQGRTSGSNDLVFTVAVDEVGKVTLNQSRALVHPDKTNDNDPVSLADGLIALTRTDTITDGDGDTSKSSASLDISKALVFEDDGPSIKVTTVVADPVTLTVDESDLAINSDGNFAKFFSSVPNYGADGAGTVSSIYGLNVQTPGGSSGLTDVATGEAVLLTVTNDGKAVEGHISSISDPVFTVTVDEFGKVILNQSRALVHPDKTNPDDSVSLADGLIALTRTDTITDGDGDASESSASLDISKALSFLDDGPKKFSPASVTLDNDGVGDKTGNLDTTPMANPWLADRVGADKPGSVAFVDNNLVDDYLYSMAGTALTSGNEKIVLSGFGTGTLLAQTETTHLTVFTATLDPTGGQYKIDFDRTIDNGSGVTFLGAASVASGNPTYDLLDNVGGTQLDILFSSIGAPNDKNPTVNVSTQGVGVSNQLIDQGETLRLDLVTGGMILNNGGDFSYTAHQTVNGFSFLLSQNQPAGTTGTVYIKAYDADDDKTLSGDADDKVQSITKVMVNGKILVDGTKVETLAINNHPVTAILYNDGVVITGLNEGNTGDGAGGDDPVIKVYTANGFDRVELTNYSDQTAGGSNILGGKAFDIAPAGIEQGVSGKPVDFQLPVQIIDQDGDTTPIELIGVHLDAMPL